MMGGARYLKNPTPFKSINFGINLYHASSTCNIQADSVGDLNSLFHNTKKYYGQGSKYFCSQMGLSVHYSGMARISFLLFFLKNGNSFPVFSSNISVSNVCFHLQIDIHAKKSKTNFRVNMQIFTSSLFTVYFTRLIMSKKWN